MPGLHTELGPETNASRGSGDRLEERLRTFAPTGARGLDRRLGLKRVFMAIKVAEPAAIRIGRYLVEERLGRGGMGSVYRARDPELQRDIAIKLLHREVTPKDTELFREEAKALARLAHPNVVAVYDLGMTNDQLYVAMQYVAGTDLRRRLSRRKRPSWQDALAMFIEAGRGLAAAHAAGIIHRDFKPENVLVGDDGKIMLADFGLARRTGHGEGQAEIVGTFEFMAPEVQRGAPADARSDQYSFCASVWKMLDPRTEPAASSEVIDGLVARILNRGLALDPADRWPSMDLLIGALEQALDERPQDRQRAILLDRMERSWLSGVLRKSLDGRKPLELPLAAAHDKVERPWSTVLPMSDERPHDTDDLDALLECGNGSLLVLGQPGGGKTTALLMLAEGLADTARVDRRAPAPVVLNLSSYATYKGTLRSWLEDEIVVKYSLPRKTVTGWLDAGELALLLDGLDEVERGRRRHCVRAINAFRAEHAMPIVVVCRTDDYDAIGVRLAFGAAVEIMPLPPSAAEAALLDGEKGASSDRALLVQDAQGEQLRTPLMLALLDRAGSRVPRGSNELRAVYDAYIGQCFSRNGVETADRARIIGGLRWLAAAIERGGTSEIWLEQLATRWFESRWQRVFARIVGLLLIVGVCGASLGAVTSVVERDPVSGGLLGLCCAPFVLIFNRGLDVKPVGRLRWSWRRAWRWLPLAVAIGLVLGGLYGLFYIIWVNVVFGGAVGLLCALSIGFEPAYVESPVRPNQGILQSAYNAVVIGTVGGLIGGTMLGYGLLPPMLPHVGPESTFVALDDPEFSVFATGGSTVGLTIAMLHGGTAVLLHAAYRLSLAATTPLPLRLVGFLEAAVQLAFMRRVGGGYIFLHRTLQEHFTAGSAPVGED